MVRFLIRLLIFFLSALLGLWVADLLLDGLTVDGKSYILVPIIFAVIQAILAPLIFRLVRKNATAFTGGVGIISTLAALIITAAISSGLTITGASTWILAALIVWLAGAIAAFVLPFFLLKKAADERRS